MARPRVLFAITVYNGRAFVPRCIDSATSLSRAASDIDVLALDDESPEPGFSELIEAHCRAKGAGYYRTPRNLGIVRNVNLGLIAGVAKGYDYVVIANSDVIFAHDVVDRMLEAADAPLVGSVTAWSNNVSAFSIPNENPDRWLSTQAVVSEVGNALGQVFRGAAIDVPSGVSFCMLFPTSVLRHVGLMDPVYGRGYGEETDWSLRSIACGYRATLCPGAFAYHQGRGSTLAAGLVSGAHTTVPENQAIVDHRYPHFHDGVMRFLAGPVLPALHEAGASALLLHALGRHRVVTEPSSDDDVVAARNGASLDLSWRGFRKSIPFDESVERSIAKFRELEPPALVSTTSAGALPVVPRYAEHPLYPERV